ncbi:SusC/RagA family TonB-linked outer membrane protein [Chitinophaga sp. S165]|uniref:SusC/RagA family TonB-linked outer membrane protein n=1 Tax=Chitinophaga sp. S165 TaxID=2135462 RepID=UPI0013050152|nr:SusC/RagA family TonB-linked outer membrane protein [Chitinophaga sp. S165]
MKLTIILLIFFLLQVRASSRAQSITLTMKDAPLKKVFAAIKKQSDYVVFYNQDVLTDTKPVSVTAYNTPLKELLEMILKDQPITFLIREKTIILSRKVVQPPVQLSPSLEVTPVEATRLLVKGIVTDTTGEPLVGASVKIKGTLNGTTTNGVGRFQIDAKPDDVLIISYMGYESREVKPGTYVIMALKPSHSRLDEVQVLAYGITTRRLSTGTISTIKAEEIARNPVVNVLEALKGRVPGMFIEQRTGQPGTPIDVTIRGKSTVLTSTQPLYIVDGVPYPSGGLPFIYASNTNLLLKGGNALDYLNPAMIESIDVLTDADATAIYGSRGGYGVVLITTKKGKGGKPVLNINAQTGVSVRGQSPRLLNLDQYLMLRREAFKNDNATPGPGDLDLNGTWPLDRNTNWMDIVAGASGKTSMFNVSYSGGVGNVNYLLAGNYNEQQSIQRNTGAYKSGGVNLNLNTTSPSGKVYLSLSGAYTSTLNDMLPVDFTNAVLLAPNAPPIFLPDGNLNWEPGASGNDFKDFKSITRNQTNNLISTTEFKYMPVKGLTFRAVVGFNMLTGRQNLGYPSTYFDPSTNYITRGSLNLYTVRTWNLDPNINYQFRLGRSGKLTATVGSTLVNKLSYNQSTNGFDFLSDDLLVNPTFSAVNNLTTSYTQTPGRSLSYFSIVNYNWADKYILNLNGRYDGSSKFGPRHRYGKFGSIGAAWIISSENWFKGVLPVVNFAKVRGSIGRTGGDAIPEYSYLNTFSNGTAYQGGVSLFPTKLYNPDLHWERILKKELALSVEFLNGRIGLDVAHYKNRSENQLVALPVASTTGSTGLPINSGAVIVNRGYDITLNTTNIRSRNFTWKSTITFSVNKNTLVAYPTGQVLTNINLVVGKSVQTIKVFDYAGVDPENGYYAFYKDGVKGQWNFASGGALRDPKDRTALMDLAPKYFGSMLNTVSYKGLSVNFVITFVDRIGRNMQGSQSLSAGVFNVNPSEYALNRWQKPGDQTNVQRASQSLIAALQQYNFFNSSGAYSSTRFARLSSLNINYNLPSSLFKKRIGNLSIFASGTNLLTISKYKDLDPDNLGAGMAPLKKFTAGLNITL